MSDSPPEGRGPRRNPCEHRRFVAVRRDDARGRYAPDPVADASPPRAVGAEAAAAGHTPAGPSAVTAVTAVEGSSAAELAAALALLPTDAVLIDFGSDAEVCLVFGPAPPPPPDAGAAGRAPAP